MNGLTIAPDGTAYIAGGGGRAPEPAAAVGSLADQLQGVLKVDGLFGADPSSATVTPEFNSLQLCRPTVPMAPRRSTTPRATSTTSYTTQPASKCTAVDKPATFFMG